MKSLQPRQTTYTKVPIVRSFLSQNYDNLSKSSSPFKDDLFPPDNTSLYSTKSTISSIKIPNLPTFLQKDTKKFLSQFSLRNKDRYSWKRLSEIYNIKDLNIITNSRILSDDVKQGELGDCYFLSILSTLGENPERIKKLFPKSKISDKGIYECDVYIHGQQIPIVIDDYFPVIENESQKTEIAFAGINQSSKSIWPMLLEKVWAKCNLSYEDIINGNSADAFEFLCPAPFDTYFHNSETKNLFDTIKDAIKKGYIVVSDITVTENTNLDYLSKMGLVTNHAYNVIDTVVLKQNETEVKLLKIKNSWGTNEWKGDWSDNSGKWTENFRKVVGLEIKQDGIFWMAYEDFIQFYTSTHICQIHDDYTFVSKKVPVSKDEAFNVVKINVGKISSGYFMVNLKNKRIYENLKGLNNFNNPFCSMSVFKQDKNGFNFIGSDSGKHDRLYVECESMEPGTYYIAVTFPKENKNFEMGNNLESKKFDKLSFRAGVYSNIKDAKIEDKIEENEKNDINDFVFNIISQLAKENPEKYHFADEGENSSYRVINFDNNKSGYGYLYYNNNSDAFLRERIQLTSLVNVNLIPILKNGKLKIEDFEKGEENEIDYEEDTRKIAMDNLKGEKLDSSAEVIEGDKGKEVSEKNPAIVQFNIAPHSQCVVLLQKSDDEADIDMISDITFDYLPNVLLSEKKFTSKKYKLRYNNKPIDIFEVITEHNSGVFFLYKNRTKEYKINVTAKFTKVDNLYLQICSNDIKTQNKLPLRNYTGKFRDDINEKVVSIDVDPGQIGFFGLSSIDAFNKYNYVCDFDYLFSMAHQNHFDDEGDDVVTKEEI